MHSTPDEANPAIIRHGAVAVIERQGRLLVIRRSANVLAPRQFCFPGGGLESGETEAEALVRELREELNCLVRPMGRLWETVTRWRVHLAWWQATIEGETEPSPNPLEVESIHWLTPWEILELHDVVDGNRQFVEALLRGHVTLNVGSR
ncbi:MAG: NUDIX domain-containing protein [Pirellulales bacterium]|nr:NUDIX domain-containing protein [Pirellulales bacterium]